MINLKKHSKISSIILFTTVWIFINSAALAQESTIQADEPSIKPESEKENAGNEKPRIDTVSIGFKTSAETCTRSNKGNVTKEIPLKISDIAKESNYLVKIEVIAEATTLLERDYTVSPKSFSISNGESETESIFITLKKDSLVDRERSIKIKLSITSSLPNVPIFNKAEYSTAILKVHPYKTIDGLDHLVFFGTNFDLVDGIEPNKFFFATNHLIINNHKPFKCFLPRTSWYFSLYGNRAVTNRDTNVNSLSRRPKSFVAQGDSFLVNRVDIDRQESNVVDNLGASFIMMPNLFGLANETRNAKFWFGPSFDFILRRKLTTISFGNERNDTILLEQKEPIIQSFNTYSTASFNYNFNYGLSFFMDYNIDKICLRFSSTIGFNSQYVSSYGNDVFKRVETFCRDKPTKPCREVFYSGKLWIIDPNSGITVQGEIYNLYHNPTPYYVVTLSKAFDFANLGSILQPLTPKKDK